MERQIIDRIIEMAWEDRTPFEAIKFQWGLNEQQVISLMRQEMSASISACGENECMAEKLSTYKNDRL